MSADEMSTQAHHDRSEMITLADILNRQVKMQDDMYLVREALARVEQMLRERMEEDRSNWRQVPPTTGGTGTQK